MRRRPKVIEQAIACFSKLGLMVNNAGIVNAGNAENKNTEEYRLTMGVHADGGVIPQSRESYVVAYCWPLRRFCEANISSVTYCGQLGLPPSGVLLYCTVFNVCS